MTTKQIEQYLRQRYRLPKWALFFEVPDKIASNSLEGEVRWRADAIAVCMEPRMYSGTDALFRIIGFEIKASRSDWLRELKKPEKSVHFSHICNEFYVVAMPNVVQMDELPPDWGWLEPGNDRPRKKATDFVLRSNAELLHILLRRAALMCEKYESIRQIIESPVYDTRMFDKVGETV